MVLQLSLLELGKIEESKTQTRLIMPFVLFQYLENAQSRCATTTDPPFVCACLSIRLD